MTPVQSVLVGLLALVIVWVGVYEALPYLRALRVRRRAARRAGYLKRGAP